MGHKHVKEITLTDTYRHNSIGMKTTSSHQFSSFYSENKRKDKRDNGPVKSARQAVSPRMSLGIRSSHKENKIIFKSNKLHNYEYEKFTIIKKTNSDIEDSALIDNCILKHFFMRSLNKHGRHEIIKEMTLVSVEVDTTIFTQGMPGHYFYILKQGTVDLLIDEEVIKQLTVGDSFGELALLHGAPRSGTVKAQTDCLFWVIERRKFKKIIEHINKINFEENKTFVESIPILANLEHYQKTILSSSLYKVVFDKGKTIVSKGDQANCIYIIKEGEVDCVQDGVVIRTLQKGDNFGERSILIDSTRTMDVIARTNCVCFSISIETLKSILGPQYRTLLYLNLTQIAVHNSKYFNGLNSDLIEETFDCFEAINLTKENVAYPIGHKKSSKIVIIIDGHLINAKTKEIVANRGTILFEKELLNNSKEKTTFALAPEPDCLFIEADTKKVLKLIGDSFLKIISKCGVISSLYKVDIFKNLPKKEMDLISKAIKIINVEKDHVIVKEGEEGVSFYIVRSGSVNVFVKNVYFRTLNAQDYFGERALLTKEPRSATVIANEASELYLLKKEAFLNVIESATMREYLHNRLYLRDNTIELTDLMFHKQLGSGNYGDVSLVKCIKNDYFYAIKSVSRKHINHEKLHHNMDLEKSILLQTDHPFIMKLVKCLKDNQNIYFLTEYIKGKDMFEGIREIGILSKEETQFFGGSIILAIKYLHDKKFIYRDIKPENIVIKNNGYIKLIDFGTAKIIIDRTSTIIGTPHYMAPEVILGEGYSFQIDYWSIAICMFEFICGCVPFGESAKEPMDVYLAIINDQLAFPSFVGDREFKRLIFQMLTKKPVNRLTRYETIKNDIWFSGFNWDDLMSLTINPSYKPKFQKEKEQEAPIPYIKHVATKTGWTSEKETVISMEQFAEYDQWYNSF